MSWDKAIEQRGGADREDDGDWTPLVPGAAETRRDVRVERSFEGSLNGSFDAPLTVRKPADNGPAPSTGPAEIVHLVNTIFRQAQANPSASRILAIASPSRGEGVSTIASLIARQLGRERGHRTLLVTTRELAALQQSDLENPRLLWREHSSCSYFEMIELTPAYDSDRQWDFNPSFRRRVCKLLQSEFDYVLLDCGSMKASNDVLTVSALVSGTVLVVKSGGSTREQIRDACQVIELAGGTVTGCCFNRQPAAPATGFARLFRK